MEPKKLLSLPGEVLQHISGYLSLRDVLACSLTCHYLRNVLNDNSVWRKYLPQIDVSKLELQHQLVQPSFQLEDTLSPLCENRKHYIRKTQLINNWKFANYVHKSAQTKYSYANGVFNKLTGNLIYNDRYIFSCRFINDMESDAIEVWDIGNVPGLQTLIKINGKDYDRFCIFKNNLVVEICCQVDVYQITLPGKEFPLRYSFLITEENVTFQTYCKYTGEHDFRCVGWVHSSIDDHYFLSNKCGEETCVLHIWDIINATKIGTFVSPVNGFSIRLHSQAGNDWILRQSMETGNDTFFFYFNIVKREYSEKNFKLPYCPVHTVFYLTHVLLFNNAKEPNSEGCYDTVCTLVDFETSTKLNERRFNNAGKTYKLSSIAVVNGTFIILCIGGFEVVNAQTLETVERIDCENLCFINHQFSVFDSVFILAAHTSNVLELWDIKKKMVVPKFFKTHYESHLHLDELCTKLVCFDYMRISALNFW